MVALLKCGVTRSKKVLTDSDVKSVMHSAVMNE